MDLTPKKLIATAERIVQARLSTRPNIALVKSVQAQGSERSLTALDVEAEKLARCIGVDSGQLRPDDRLGEILRVYEGELPPHARPLLRKFGHSDHILIGGFAILDHVEQRMAEVRSIVRERPFVPSPKSEDEWMDRIMGMTVGELLTVLA